jgi:cysteine protease ATG4
MFWDPEPTNDPFQDLPVWCLGCSYTLGHQKNPNRESLKASPPAAREPTETEDLTASKSVLVPPNAPETPPDSVSSSFSSSLAYDEQSEDGGWPPGFLDDFEAKFWMTYRSEFETIPKSADPRAVAALSLRMRIKSVVDQNGFSSDSGWGCMIRSGQSLLANTIAMLQLGRGRLSYNIPPLTVSLIGT